MRFYDISIPISRGTPVFEGDPPVLLRPAARIEKGAPLNLTRITLGSHTGTHIDAPYHFVETGETVDRLPLEVFSGPALVREVPVPRAIGAGDLEAADVPHGTERLLLKTRNSALWGLPGFQRDFVYLEPDAARWLVDRGLRLVGIDYLSVERFGSVDFATHHTLLGGGVIVLEGLDLRGVPPGPYRLICLPLRIAGCDGAPTRAVLVEEQG